jgi:hypothetical protein
VIPGRNQLREKAQALEGEGLSGRTPSTLDGVRTAL